MENSTPKQDSYLMALAAKQSKTSKVKKDNRGVGNVNSNMSDYFRSDINKTPETEQVRN